MSESRYPWRPLPYGRWLLLIAATSTNEYSQRGKLRERHEKTGMTGIDIQALKL